MSRWFAQVTVYITGQEISRVLCQACTAIIMQFARRRLMLSDAYLQC